MANCFVAPVISDDYFQIPSPLNIRQLIGQPSLQHLDRSAYAHVLNAPHACKGVEVEGRVVFLIWSGSGPVLAGSCVGEAKGPSFCRDVSFFFFSVLFGYTLSG